MVQKVKQFFGACARFLGETVLEGKRISWPGRRELVDSTLVVIVFIILLAAVIMACDEVIRAALRWVLGGNA